MHSKNAMGNLVNRYRAVLKKCSLLNVFGTLAVAGLMVVSGMNNAQAADFTITQGWSGTFTDGDDVYTDSNGLVTSGWHGQNISSAQYNGKTLNSLTIGSLSQTMMGALKFQGSGTLNVTNDILVQSGNVTDRLQGSYFEIESGVVINVAGNVTSSGYSEIEMSGRLNITGNLNLHNTAGQSALGFYSSAGRVETQGETVLSAGTVRHQNGHYVAYGETTIGGDANYTANWAMSNSSSSFTAHDDITIKSNGTLNANSKIYAQDANIILEGGTLSLTNDNSLVNAKGLHLKHADSYALLDYYSYSSWSGTRVADLNIGVNGLVIEVGTFEFQGGSLTFADLNNTITLGSAGKLKIGEDGKFNAYGALDVAGTLEISGGTYTAEVGEDLNITGKVYLEEFEKDWYGTISYKQSTINNQALTNVDGGNVTVAKGGTFNATGATIVKNNGTIDVTAGVYNAGIAGEVASNTTVSSGKISVGANGTYNAVNGVNITGGSIENSGAFTVDALNVTNGSYIHLDGSTKTSSLTIGSGGSVSVKSGIFELNSNDVSTGYDSVSGGMSVSNSGTLSLSEAFINGIEDNKNEVNFFDGGTLFITDLTQYDTDQLQDLLKKVDVNENDDQGAFVYATNVVLGRGAVLANNNIDAMQLGNNKIDVTTNSFGANLIVEYQDNKTINASYTAQNMTLSSGDTIKLGVGTVNLVANGGNVGTKADGSLASSINLGEKAHLNLQGSGTVGTLNVNNGSIAVAGDYTFNQLNLGENDAKIAGNIETTILKATTGLVDVGDNNAQTVLKTDTIEGGIVYVSQAWGNSADTSIATASKILVKDINDSSLLVGKNSVAIAGDTSTDWLDKKLEVATVGNGEAVVWGANGNTGSIFTVYGDTYSVGSGDMLVVDGTLDYAHTTASTEYSKNLASFSSRSLFVIDASIPNISSTLVNGVHVAGSDYALKVDSDVRLQLTAGAKLYLANIPLAADNKVTLNIAQFDKISQYDGTWGYSSKAPNNIDTSSVVFESAFFRVEDVIKDKDSYQLVVKQISVEEALPGLDSSLTNAINDARANAVVSDSMSYINRLSVSRDTGTGSGQAVEGAAKLAVAGGAVQSSLGVVNSSVANIGKRTSMTSSLSFASAEKVQPKLYASNDTNLHGENFSTFGYTNGLGAWVSPLFQYTSSDGYESGNDEYGYSTSIFGTSIGADYTMNQSIRVGASFHVGTGDSDSKGAYNPTSTEATFYGASLYGGYHFDKWIFSGDFGYTLTNNDVKQNSVSGALEADFDYTTLAFGAKAEYLLYTHMLLELVPHIGFRYVYTDIDSYDSTSGNVTIFNTKKSDSSIFSIPVGLTASRNIITDSGFVFTPRFDLGMNYSFGDLEMDQVVSISGINALSVMTSEIQDPISVTGGLGLGMIVDNMNLDLDYTFEMSANMRNHNVVANFRYTF